MTTEPTEPRVVVVGSLSMDFTARAPTMPRLGETVMGDAFTMVPGGKGDNQCVTAARQGASVAMVGCVGADELGDRIAETLEHERVDTTFLSRSRANQTGIAHITVDHHGDNSIIVIPFANHDLRPEMVEQARPAVAGASVLLTQLEVPLETVERSLAIAREEGTTTILNPAPALPLPGSVLELVDVLVPNETEAGALTGMAVESIDDAKAAAADLLDRGPSSVVVTLGSKGAVVASDGAADVVAPFRVTALDATAAGDAFCGSLAAALASGQAFAQALERAAAAGALAATVAGALPSLPRAGAVDALIASTPGDQR